MERRKKIPEQIITDIHQSHLPKFSIAFDLAARSNPSAPHVDHSLLSRKIIGQSSSAIDRKFSDPEFLPIPSSIIQDNEGTSFDDLEYGANVARW